MDAPVDIEINLVGKEGKAPSLLGISGFLYDFNLCYELSRLATDPRYEHFRFSHYSLFRNGRPLRDEDRLRVRKLSHSSPIELQTLLWGAPLAIGAVWGLVQIVEKVSNWKLNRRKLEEEIKKLERENFIAAQGQHSSGKETPPEFLSPPVFTEEEFIVRTERREARHLINGVTKRLDKSEVHVEKMEIRFIRRTRELPPEK